MGINPHRKVWGAGRVEEVWGQGPPNEPHSGRPPSPSPPQGLNLFKELLAPYTAADYRELFEAGLLEADLDVQIRVTQSPAVVSGSWGAGGRQEGSRR